MNTPTYQWLDLVRALSAVLVCANHLRAAMFVDYAALPASSLWVKCFYLLTGLGGQAVVVFFVLSGFFVGGSVLRQGRGFDYARYLLSRLTRLWVVLLPALVLTFLVDRATLAMAPGLLAGQDSAILNSGPASAYSDSLLTFVQNLLFLQTVTAPVFGSNGPLWSLANEFWYYLCFPLILMAWDKGRQRWARALAATLLLLAVWLVLEDKRLGFCVWIVGALAYCIPLARPRLALTAALPAFAIALALSKVHLIGAGLQTLLLGLATAMLIVALRGLAPMGRSCAVATDCLARSSFTLYLIHFPLVLLLYAVCFRTRQCVPTLEHCALFGGVLVGLVALAQVAWMLFERHTERIRRWVLLLWERRSRHTYLEQR